MVWKLDRLSRRGVGQVGQLLDQFEHVGGRLVSVQDQLDTAQPQARMIIALLSEFAIAESETMGMRVKAAKRAQRSQGLWLSGKPPFGYEVAPDKRLRPVEPAASMMREVFEGLAAGHTLTSMCALLNERGFTNSWGNRWRATTLSEAVRSPAYAGMTPERHVTAEGLHAPGYPAVYRDADTGLEVSCLTPGAEPIVSRALQLAAFDMLQRRWRRYGRGEQAGPRRQAHALLLRGLGRCAGCGGPLVTFNGYRCRSLNAFGEVTCSTPANAMVPTVDRRVEAEWVRWVTRPDPRGEPLRLALARRWASPRRRTPNRVRLESDLLDLRVRLDDADSARYVRGELDAARHRRVAEELTRRINVVQDRLQELPDEIDTTALHDAVFVKAHWDGCGYDGRRDLVRVAWENVILSKAARRGGRFDERRLTYVPHESTTTPLPQGKAMTVEVGDTYPDGASAAIEAAVRRLLDVAPDRVAFWSSAGVTHERVSQSRKRRQRAT